MIGTACMRPACNSLATAYGPRKTYTPPPDAFGPALVTAHEVGDIKQLSIAHAPKRRSGVAGLPGGLNKAGALLAEVACTKAKRSGVAESRRTTSTVDYDYRLSKRTDVYALYVYDKKSNAASAGSTALGLSHLF